MRPDTPIVLAADSDFRNIMTQKGGLTAEIWKKLTGEGDKHLFFLTNVGMIGDDGEGTVDACHLTDLGMLRQAEAFDTVLRTLLQE